MKDKFDLFERYSDDVVAEYICAFVGIDNLGIYNRFYNYLTGDAVIEEVKEKLVEMFEYDNVYKFSNTRFIVMSRIPKNKIADFDYRDKQMLKIADDIKRVIEPSISVNSTLTEARKVKLRIGVSADDRQSQVQNIFLLVKLADICHNICAIEDKDYVCTDEAFILAEVEKEMVADTIESAINNNEFYPYFQPIVEPLSRKIVGVETLIRWHKDSYKILTPDKFLEVADEKELTHKIDLSVIEQVVPIIRIWKEDQLVEDDFNVNINISIHTLERLNFKLIHDLVKKNHLEPNIFVFELPSEVFINQYLMEKVLNIKKHGFKIAIDNFGSKDITVKFVTKASNVDLIKINKSLLPLGTVEASHEKLYRTIVTFANIIDADIIANGVETLKQIDFCTYCGVDKVQGFYFTKVLSENEFKLFLEKYKEGII